MKIVLSIFLLVLFFVRTIFFPSEIKNEVSVEIEKILNDDTRNYPHLLKTFYQSRSWNPAWVNGSVAAIYDSIKHYSLLNGLSPSNYNIGQISSFLSERQPDKYDLALTDIHITEGLLKLSGDLGEGITRNKVYKKPRVDFIPLSATAIERSDPSFILRSVAPATLQYRLLQKNLSVWALQLTKNWLEFPKSLTLEEGDTGIAVQHLRDRLSLYGINVIKEGRIFDKELTDCVVSFQQLHQINPTGKVKALTIAALNVSPEKRFRQTIINLERHRWLPAKDTVTAVVNIPSYDLRISDKTKELFVSRVIVGKATWPTPLLSSNIKSLVFYPYWNVPPRIAQKEVIPEILSDPGYLAKNRMVVLHNGVVVTLPQIVNDLLLSGEEVLVRQDPGEGNSLGLVKFIFPNTYNVYLHDTPEKRAFNRQVRAISHGCVRVEKAIELAGFLTGEEMVRRQLDTAGTGIVEKYISLKADLPLFITYHTISFSPEGTAYSKDIYGLDKTLEKKMSVVFLDCKKAVTEVSGRTFGL